jgi:hypothetical protein
MLVLMGKLTVIASQKSDSRKHVFVGLECKYEVISCTVFPSLFLISSSSTEFENYKWGALYHKLEYVVDRF